MKKNIFLGFPHWDYSTPYTADALMRASKKHKINLVYKYSSTLCFNFNSLWCNMLNIGGMDYFAMLHSDVVPPPFWIDELLKEMGENDIISAIIPIKDHLKRVSTSVLTEVNGGKEIYCLTYDEVEKLPTTFTKRNLKDIGKNGILLVNTGCWIAKTGEWCKEFPGFHMDNVIKYNKKTKKYEPKMLSEDWLFSSWCDSIGLKIAATKCIKPLHFGKQNWVLP